MRQARRLILTMTMALLAGAALCGSAWGATVQVVQGTIPPESEGGDPETVFFAALLAKPGEVNRVKISPGPNDTTVLIEDLGANLTIGTGCVGLDAHHARCNDPSGERTRVVTGDLDDLVVALPGTAISAQGGPGTDQLLGADGLDVLSGGGGAGDILTGGGGDDVLTDGDGDGVSGTAVDADTLHGADGTDTINYANRTGGATVDLSKTTQAEGDAVTTIENVEGSKGADKITGSAGKNVLAGGTGNDVIKAGDGADSVIGGTGSDRISLGSGNDRVDDRDQKTPTGTDEINCGKGNDRIKATTEDKSIDTLTSNCESFAANEVGVDGNFVGEAEAISAQLGGLRRSGNRVLVPVRCRRPTGIAACVITGKLRAPGTNALLATPVKRVTVKAGKTGTLRLRLTNAGQTKVQSGKKFRLLIADRTAPGKAGLLDRAYALARVLVR